MAHGKRIVAGAVAALALLGLAALAPADEKGGEWVRLFNGKDLSGWKMFLDPKTTVDPETVWSVREETILCRGRPNGYLITDKEYGDYVLRLKWRWGGKPGNSGVFVHVSGPDKIWPKGVEAQLAANNAGDFWLVDGFKLRIDPSRQDSRSARHYFRLKGVQEKPVGQWNQYEITCKGDTVTLVVNGQRANEGTGAEATKGKILLQSEGAEIHFRDIELKSLR